MWWRLPAILTLLLFCFALVSGNSLAQGEPQFEPYENDVLGIAFNIPANWEAQQNDSRLTLSTPANLERIENGLLPQTLVLSVVTGSYTDLRLDRPEDIAERVQQLVPAGVTSPTPYEVSYGNINGFETEFVLTDNALVTRVAIMTSTDGRIAIVRGIAPQGDWAGVTSLQLQTIMESMRFILPQSMQSPLDNVNDNDGGVLWQYQIAQGRDQRAIELGGIAYDSEDIAYVAAGERGFLAIRRDTGEFINFLGPIFSNDNFTDVSIAPDGTLYFANASVSAGRRIMVVDRAGNLQSSWGIAGEEPGQFAPGMPQTIGVTAFGDVWTISEGHSTPPTNRLYRFSQDGNFFQMIDLATFDPQMQNARLDVNRVADRIYVVGPEAGIFAVGYNADVLVRGLARNFLAEAVATDISVAPNGDLVVATRNEGFITLNSQGILQDRFGYIFDAERGGRFLPGEYALPEGIAVWPDGTVLFAETHPETGFAQVQAFTFTGQGLLPIAQRTPPISENSSFSADLADGGELEYGTVVRGLLNEGSPSHEYTFFGQSGDRIEITMRSINPEAEGALDTWLFLFDGSYNTLQENDDVGTATDTLVSTDSQFQYTVPSNGTYIIRATRFGGEGVYELVVSKQE